MSPSEAKTLIKLPCYCVNDLSKAESQSKLCYDRRSVSHSVFVSGVQDQSSVTVRQSRVYSRGTPSLTRGWACCLRLLLALARDAILGSESRGTHDHI
jgi:hypothetical protein